MALRIFDRLARWLAVQRYRGNLGRLLFERYGRQRYYTPPQVLTTIKVHGLSERFAPYACAMFCSERAYSEFAGHLPHADTVGTLTYSSVSLWVGGDATAWPTHHDVSTDFGQHDSSGQASNDFGHHSHDFGSGHHGGAGGDDGGGHDGGAGGDGS